MKNKFYIIHGYGANSESNFFPWLKQKIHENNLGKCEILNLPDSENPKLKVWLNYLTKNINEPDANTFFIAHSLGCITVLKYLDNLKTIHKIGGLFLVSGFEDNLPLFPELDEFTDDKINYQNIISFVNQRIVISANNDELVPMQFSKSLAKNIKANFLNLDGYGHFLVTEVPQIYALLVSIENKSV